MPDDRVEYFTAPGVARQCYITVCAACNLPAVALCGGIPREDTQGCPFCGNFGPTHHRPYNDVLSQTVMVGEVNRDEVLSQRPVDAALHRRLMVDLAQWWRIFCQPLTIQYLQAALSRQDLNGQSAFVECRLQELNARTVRITFSGGGQLDVAALPRLARSRP
ncbi:hypothetical protein HY933_01415 [Candidatus Falkowbacteria bacterium]|nr:hypothetical protein [Candidatus Falkowbacteria bacterium]